MKKTAFVIFLVILFMSPCLRAASPVLAAQSRHNSPSEIKFDMSNPPQWVKDMRRWDIVAFGTFPFSMFTVTFFTDLNRWDRENGMDFSDEGRRYAPWPLKAAGAEEMPKEEFEKVMISAAILSASIAFMDLIIVNIKRYKERRRAERLPSGSVIIDKSPYNVSENEHNYDMFQHEDEIENVIPEDIDETEPDYSDTR
jgi:hypothetical protein